MDIRASERHIQRQQQQQQNNISSSSNNEMKEFKKTASVIVPVTDL